MAMEEQITPVNVAPLGYLRLEQVLKLIPVCPATWWNGVKSGIYPKGYKISERGTGWKVSDIIECLQNFKPI